MLLKHERKVCIYIYVCERMEKNRMVEQYYPEHQIKPSEATVVPPYLWEQTGGRSRAFCIIYIV